MQGKDSIELRALERKAEAARVALKQYQQNRTATEGKDEAEEVPAAVETPEAVEATPTPAS